MCKVNFYTTEIYFKTMVGDAEYFGEVEHVSIKGRHRSQVRRMKLLRSEVCKAHECEDDDIIACKEISYKIVEHTYHLNWAKIEEYGTEVATNIVFEG